ncbi:MAG TPA: HD-GYP domain-containing protein [Vicinamibacterales bacterium]|nr:HD-GYP domain-containing protein [Vicinamibacterales bacterium]
MMLDPTTRFHLSDEVLRRFGANLRGIQLYAPNHPIVTRNLTSLAEALRALHEHDATIVIGILGAEMIVGDLPMTKASSTMGEVIRRFAAMGVERVTIARGVTVEELNEFTAKFKQLEDTYLGDELKEATGYLNSAHIRVGKVSVDESAPQGPTDGSIRRTYAEAVSVASIVWESARSDTRPDPTAANTMIDGLAQAVTQNRSALTALTALRDYDNYTFTHMVNVSILTMSQARGLGIEGPLLREFGLAGLMHDIGKVKTPAEILNKPGKLTPEEFEIMKRHTVDGAEILRGTPDIPALAPVVAFEHHLRIDGTGYPQGVTRSSLNLATMLCGIADVYDAMRSQRKYQQAFPSERILAVLQLNDGKQFDQNLIRRFVQLLGIYPVGNMVKLDSGEIAIVLQVHAPDPYRPKVRVLFDAGGTRLELPHDVNLWEAQAPSDHRATSVIAPLDPADYGIDPLAFI